MRAKINRTGRYADVEIEVKVSAPIDSTLSSRVLEDFIKEKCKEFAKAIKEKSDALKIATSERVQAEFQRALENEQKTGDFMP